MDSSSLTSTLVFFVNGNKIADGNVDPECTLLNYLRKKLYLTGTKDGCSEGGCGACTVMVSHLDNDTGKMRHFSANACLMPVVSLHGLSVTTIEGIGSARSRLHPIQERLIKAHGTQCGFCTPGFIMSMYALLRNCPQPTMEAIEQNLVGNLCRCTGYRPIAEGFRTFSSEFIERGCCQKENCCKGQNFPPDGTSSSKRSCCRSSNAQMEASRSATYDPSQEVIFPPELKLRTELDRESLFFRGSRVKYFRPTSLEELLSVKNEYPEAKIIAGNTEIGIETRFKNICYTAYVSTSKVAELHSRKMEPTGVSIGASLPLSDVEDFLRDVISKIPEHQTRILTAIVTMLDRFSGKQIRNVATLGGNIMTGSPISDLNPIFMASKCTLSFRNSDDERKVSFDNEFFTGYRQNASKPDEVLVSIFIPFSGKHDYLFAYKQSRRRDDDVAIVNAAFNASFSDRKVSDIRMAFGGMAPTVVMPLKTMKRLLNCLWDDKLLDVTITSLIDELSLDPSAPGGMIEYRQALTISFFYKFYFKVRQLLGEESIFLEEEESLSISACSGTQFYQRVQASQNDNDPVGRPIANISSPTLATGEASFTDDIPSFENELAGAFVLSSKAHAKMLKVDESEALKMEGVTRFICARDISECSNKSGREGGEEIFASNEVHCVGQIIGIVLAHDEETARRAAKLVDVTYEELPNPIITIQDAVEASSYCGPWDVTTGDVNEAFKSSDHVLEGKFCMGGQEHFYMEPNSHIAIPHDGEEMEVISTCQDLACLQKDIVKAIGYPAHKIICRVKRIGGGFGGKERRSIPVALPAVVAAQRIGRPVRITLNRHEDMLITGGRHPMTCKWKVGFRNGGRILALEVTLHSNSGWSLDVSDAVMQLCILKFDGAYKIANWKIEGFCCKTNLPSNTAHRGSGAPQATIMMENIVTRVADFLGLHPNEIREKNFYSASGDINHFGMKLEDITLHKCWHEVLEVSNFERRQEDIKKYNSNHSLKKRGICAIPMKYGNSFLPTFLNQAGALVLVYTDGSVMLSYGGIEMGQGLHTKMVQIASRVLEIPLHKIHVVGTSTDKVPNATPTAASISSDLCGMALIEACNKIKKRLSVYKEKKPDATWDIWVEDAYFDRVSLSATGHYLTPGIQTYDFETRKGHPFNYFSYGAAVSEVEVDCITGDHMVRRTDIIMDVGNSLNPAIDVGQIEGAFTHGLGLYTLEEHKYSLDGHLLTKGPGAYKIPGIRDIPREFNVHLLKDSPNTKAVYSSKAIGEPPLMLAGSVFFAIRDAIRAYRQANGKDLIFDLNSPATVERIRMACVDHLTDKINPLPEDGSYKPWCISPF